MQYTIWYDSQWNFQGMKQASYHHHEAICTNRLISIYNKQELPGMHVAQGPSLALQSEYFLHTWHKGAGFVIYLIVYHCADFSYLAFSSPVSSTNDTKRFKWLFFSKFRHYQAEASIKKSASKLIYYSLPIQLYFEKLVTYSCIKACNNSTQ